MLGAMKKRDWNAPSVSLGVLRGSENRLGSVSISVGGSPFSLRHLLPFHHRRKKYRSKSRMSLQSESNKSESSLVSHNVSSFPSVPVLHNSGLERILAVSGNTGERATVMGRTASQGSYATATTSLLGQAVTLSSRSQEGCSLPFAKTGLEAVRECPMCLLELPGEWFPDIQTCEHRSCRSCLRRYFQLEISESRVSIACPECHACFHPNDLRDILQDDLLIGKYEEFMLRRVLASDADTRWCPAPDCGYAVIAAGCAGCPKLKCGREGCDSYFCYHCKQFWHPNQTCDAARAERATNTRSVSVVSCGSSHDSGVRSDIKLCPRCGAFIVKMNDGSCNHMTCAMCAAEFCWLCMREISDLHYLSPSGCTFWGSKPWGRKKKILWQLGTLVGAPVGITLLAAVAVPAMIIGIPVCCGRKVYARCRQLPKHRRRLLVTGGLVGSVLAAPVITGLAVGIGVPILLAYIYGVVPVSMCRNGGCGVNTTTGGVRFDFENEANARNSSPGDAQSETMPNVANPSIAPSIGDASLGMSNSLSASSSHMDRVGVLRDSDSVDRDSSSNRAMAGSSLNGSICGNVCTNRLGVGSDTAQPVPTSQKRSSFSSESANVSLSGRSATISFDEVSIRIAKTDASYRQSDRVAETFDGNDLDVGGNKGRSVSPPVFSCPIGFYHHNASVSSVADVCGQGGAKCRKMTRFVDNVTQLASAMSASGSPRCGAQAQPGVSGWVGTGTSKGADYETVHPFGCALKTDDSSVEEVCELLNGLGLESAVNSGAEMYPTGTAVPRLFPDGATCDVASDRLFLSGICTSGGVAMAGVRPMNVGQRLTDDG